MRNGKIYKQPADLSFYKLIYAFAKYKEAHSVLRENQTCVLECQQSIITTKTRVVELEALQLAVPEVQV